MPSIRPTGIEPIPIPCPHCDATQLYFAAVHVHPAEGGMDIHISMHDGGRSPRASYGWTTRGARSLHKPAVLGLWRMGISGIGERHGRWHVAEISWLRT
jgi:hypothetical protein